MGVWGYGPFENDDASDMVAGLMRSIARVVTAKTDRAASRFYARARSAGMLIMIAHGTDILGVDPRLSLIVHALARMRADREWLASFDRPARIAQHLDEETGRTLSRINMCRSCRKEYGPKGLKELHQLMIASKVELPPKPIRRRRSR